MANSNSYHCSIKAHSRRGGKSVLAAAAYRAGALLHDERIGKTFDYTPRGGVVASFLVLPKTASPWMHDRSLLWNMVEWTEKHCRATLARECEVALPAVLNAARRETVVRRICQFLVDRYGVAVDAAIHLPGQGDERNHHAHILFTTREVTREGFGKKTRVLDDRATGKEEVKAIREEVAKIINAELTASGQKERVDHRSHKDRGIDAPPQIHEGVNARAASRRGKKILSFPKLERSGRVVDYPAIDHGTTRAQHNADIIDLQKYREAETLREKLARINSMVISNAASIEEMLAALDSGLLSESMIVLLRVRIEQLISQICREGKETAFLRQRREEKAKEKQVKEMTVYQERLLELQREIEEQIKKEKEKQEGDRRMFAAVNSMAASLIGIPPYKIRLEIPLSSQFNESSYRGTLKKQSNAALLKAVLAPSSLPDKPALAVVTLRESVLQVQELLSRAKKMPPKGAGGVGSVLPLGVKIKMR